MLPTNKKAQMEILGLALIVLLIGLGLLFAVQYTLKKPTTTTQKTKESILAANYLTTLLNTNTPCNKRTVKELFQDCVLSRPVDCSGQKPCSYVSDIIQTTLTKTLTAWNKRYDFHIEGADATKDMTFSSTNRGKACTAAIEKESKTHLLTITAGFDISLILDIC